MDVAVASNARGDPLNVKDLILQGEIYREVAACCLRCPQCSIFQMWGVNDEYSWIPMFSDNACGHALLFDREYRRKPAYYGLLRSLSESTRVRDILNGERGASTD